MAFSRAGIAGCVGCAQLSVASGQARRAVYQNVEEVIRREENWAMYGRSLKAKLPLEDILANSSTEVSGATPSD